MLIIVLKFIFGLYILIKTANMFIDGATEIAKNFNISKTFIGVTIVAFGTGLPELAIAINSMILKSSDMLVGNVIGSNIINALLIVGLSSIISPININKSTIRKELPFCLIISTLLTVLFINDKLWSTIGTISRVDGVVILLYFVIFIYYIFTISRNKIDLSGEVSKYKLNKSILYTIIGAVGVILGSEIVVNNAISIAKILGISEKIISLTIVAFGTSLPELTTSITSAVKKEHELLIGNIIGSNIFNICIVLGIPAIIFGNLVPNDFNIIDLLALIISSLILTIFSRTKYKITRSEGYILLLILLIYYIQIFI